MNQYDRVPFGKHKGALLAQVPSSYLAWMAGNFGNPRWRRIAQCELDRRAELMKSEPASATVRPAWLEPNEWPGPGDVLACQLPTGVLTSEQAELLERAKLEGVLRCPLWLPLRSPIRAMWAAWCLAHGIEPRIDEEPVPLEWRRGR